ncbi:MAG: YfiR family protein [Bacteroidetes bacterium]|nr:YfiR family protein [Bacteroidota bacterium]
MLKGREMNGNKFVVVEAENVNAIQSSSIIFIASSKIESIKEIRERFKSQSVLIITEEVKFPAGSNINIVSRNDKLAFELNETDLKAQGLKVSHQLHDLAVKVY